MVPESLRASLGEISWDIRRAYSFILRHIRRRGFSSDFSPLASIYNTLVLVQLSSESPDRYLPSRARLVEASLVSEFKSSHRLSPFIGLGLCRAVASSCSSRRRWITTRNRSTDESTRSRARSFHPRDPRELSTAAGPINSHVVGRTVSSLFLSPSPSLSLQERPQSRHIRNGARRSRRSITAKRDSRKWRVFSAGTAGLLTTTFAGHCVTSATERIIADITRARTRGHSPRRSGGIAVL